MSLQDLERRAREEDPTRVELVNDPLERRFRGVAIHGNTPFDMPYMSHITGNLYVGGCETGLMLPHNIKHLISLYPWERYGVEHQLLSFLEVTMFDSFDQDTAQVEAIAAWARECMETGPTLIHCQAGLNRSNLIAATVLIQQGMSPGEAVGLLRSKRSPAVLCNKAFEAHLLGGPNG